MKRRQFFFTGLVALVPCFFALCNAATPQCNALPPDNIDCSKMKQPSVREYCRGSVWGNVVWASSNSPLANSFPPNYVPVLSYFHRLYSTMPERVRRKRESNNLRGLCRSSHRRSENGWKKVHSLWSNAVIKDQVRFGNPPPNTVCFTEIVLSARESEQVWSKMVALSDAYVQTGKRAKLKALNGEGTSFFERELRCWKRIVSPMMAPTTTSSFECNVAHGVGVRSPSDEIFNIRMALTDEPLNRSMADRSRHYLVEQFQVDGNRVRAVPISSHRVGSLEGFVNNTSTILATWGGTVKVTYTSKVPSVEGPAMRYVEKMSNKNRESIEDGVTVSNIAILILPCLLAIVPLAAIEGVSRSYSRSSFRILLIYAIGTDLISVLPLCIKGVEMLVQARTRYIGCVAWNVGVEGVGLAVVELWCANCSHHTKFQVYGCSFISIALMFLIAGVLLEVLVLRKQKKARKRLDYDSWWIQPRESTYDDQLVIPFCTEYDCNGPFAPSCGISTVRQHFSYYSYQHAAGSAMNAEQLRCT